MKKTNIILSFVICILSYGCTDLSETVYTGVAMNDFFKNEKELVANAGRAYTKLQGYNSEQSYGHCFYKLLMNVLFPLVVVPGTVMDVMKKSRRIKFHLQINY